MVALSLGLLILLGIGAAYVNAQHLARQREDLSALSEPGRIAIGMLRHHLMHAGYVDLFDRIDDPALGSGTPAFTSTRLLAGPPEQLLALYDRAPGQGQVAAPLTVFFPGVLPVFGCDGAMNDSPANIATASVKSALLTTQATPMPSCGAPHPTRHTLQIAQQSQSMQARNPLGSLSAFDTASGDGLDCLQQKPPTVNGRSIGLVVNRFSLASSSASGVRQFRCAGSGGTGAEDIASGVEELVFRYQTSAPGDPDIRAAAGGTALAFMSATDVSASVGGWPSVVAVEVCMVLATPSNTGPAATGSVELQRVRPTCERDTRGGFQPDLARAPGDRRLWKRVTAVVALRNAVFATPSLNTPS